MNITSLLKRKLTAVKGSGIDEILSHSKPFINDRAVAAVYGNDESAVAVALLKLYEKHIRK